MESFKQILSLIKENYKKELAIWILGNILFFSSLGFLIYQGINYWKILFFKKKAIEYQVKVLKEISKLKEFTHSFKENGIAEVKRIPVKGEVSLKNIDDVIKFFGSFNNLEKREYFVLKEAIKQGPNLKFVGEKVIFLKEEK